ncbi:MAG: alpha/beta hydrolase [Clostridiaceae bacterium]|nr:alpha/beta hydrolase [Clostridiaceae bacterium]
MSIGFQILKAGLRISGIKKLFSLPEERLLEKARKLNRHRRFQMPRDHKYRYADELFFGRFHCLKIETQKRKAAKAVLFLYGGGMILGPDAGDLKVACEIGKKCGADIWFPHYPLCLDHSIEDTYQMLYAVYQRMAEAYGADNISFVGFSSGAALAIGICLYNNEQARPLPMPKRIIAVSSGCVPSTDEERAKMEALSKKDIIVDAAFMSTVKGPMAHGKEVPQYMLSGVYGNFANFPEIHFYYGSDEVLFAEADSFAAACEKYRVTYHMHIGQGLCHCYPMAPFLTEGKAARSEIIHILCQPSP